MALFKNAQKSQNSDVKSVATFEGYTDFSRSYQDAIYKRIIGDCLSSLDYKDSWSLLYRSNIIEHLYRFIMTGRMKGGIYITTNKTCVGYLPDSSDNKINELEKQLLEGGSRKVDIDITMDADTIALVGNLGTTFDLLKTLASNLGTNVSASSLIQVKFKDLRLRGSEDISEGILKSVAESIKDNKNGFVVLDAEDELIFGVQGEQLSTMLEAEKHLTALLSKLLGFPISYFSGQSSIGLGSENINDKEAFIRARENFYYRFLQPFFLLVSKECGVDISPQTIAKDRFTPKELYDIAQFDDAIDKEEIYKQLNLPLKKR